MVSLSGGKEQAPSERSVPGGGHGWRRQRATPPARPGLRRKLSRREKCSYSNLFSSLAKASPTRAFRREEGSDPHPSQPLGSYPPQTFQAGRSRENPNCPELQSGPSGGSGREDFGIPLDQGVRPAGGKICYRVTLDQGEVT